VHGPVSRTTAGHRDCNAHAHSHQHADGDAYGNRNADSATDAIGDSDGDADRHCHNNAGANIHVYTDSRGSHRDARADIDGTPFADPDRGRVADTRTFAKRVARSH
jgi:hypothetical protein